MNALKRDDSGDGGVKTCNVCKQTKSRTEFYVDRSRPDGLLYRCISCHKAMTQSESALSRRRAYNREPHVRAKRWPTSLKKYGLTLDDWHRMIVAQSGRCAACSEPLIYTERPVHVDHCHDSGVVRGLLCGACNTSEGLLRGNPQIILGLLSYVCGFTGEGVYECTLQEALNSLRATNR